MNSKQEFQMCMVLVLLGIETDYTIKDASNATPLSWLESGPPPSLNVSIQEMRPNLRLMFGANINRET